MESRKKLAFCPEQGEEEEKAKHCDHKVIKRATCLADATFDASDKKIRVGNFWVDHQDLGIKSVGPFEERNLFPKASDDCLDTVNLNKHLK